MFAFELDPLGIYISIPFCRSKCTYCNFASGVFPLSSLDRYIARLEEDLHAIRGRAAGWGAVVPEVVDTVYLGGGTPSLLSPAKEYRTVSVPFGVILKTVPSPLAPPEWPLAPPNAVVP